MFVYPLLGEWGVALTLTVVAISATISVRARYYLLYYGLMVTAPFFEAHPDIARWLRVGYAPSKGWEHVSLWWMEQRPALRSYGYVWSSADPQRPVWPVDVNGKPYLPRLPAAGANVNG